MRRRRWLLAGSALVLAGFGAVVAGVAWRDGAWEAWSAPELTRATDAPASPVRLVVGKNVHVSAGRPDTAHQGCTVAADPGDPRRLFAASMVTPRPDAAGVVGYFSHDGGASWELGCERLGRAPGEQCCDEAVAFGPGGELFLAHMRGRFGAPDAEFASTEVLASGDGGQSWAERAVVKGLADRPQLAADVTPGPFRGRLYCNVNLLAGGRNVAAVYASADGARTLTPADLPDPALPTVHNSNPAVLADGTLVVAYHRSGGNAASSPRIPVWRSTDGGQTFAAATPVRTVWRHPRARSTSGTTLYPRLAADAGSPGGAGRLYCAWTDGPFVLFSSSADRGDTWADPVLLSEQSLGADPLGDYYAGLPAIAVNPLGQIAVLWYDRRGLPPKAVGPGGVVRMAGYNVRMRASTDGGRTWLPSGQVNEVPGRGDPLEVRFWVGLAAGADGRFHPAWISDSSGTLQVWTAAVTLDGPR
jgi:hypothetical protein